MSKFKAAGLLALRSVAKVLGGRATVATEADIRHASPYRPPSRPLCRKPNAKADEQSANQAMQQCLELVLAREDPGQAGAGNN